jgi:CheY-like chemotaxis protein
MSQAGNLSILVIEDSEPIRELICLILEEEGCHVESAENGEEGFELVTKRHFDMVFTDLMMPVMSGFELAEKIKGINKNITLVLVTAWATDYSESELHNKGIDYIVKKPFKDNQILQLLHKEVKV